MTLFLQMFAAVALTVPPPEFVDTPEPVAVFRGESGNVWIPAPVRSGDGRHVLLSTDGSDVRAIDLNTFEVVSQFKFEHDPAVERIGVTDILVTNDVAYVAATAYPRRDHRDRSSRSVLAIFSLEEETFMDVIETVEFEHALGWLMPAEQGIYAVLDRSELVRITPVDGELVALSVLRRDLLIDIARVGDHFVVADWAAGTQVTLEVFDLDGTVRSAVDFDYVFAFDVEGEEILILGSKRDINDPDKYDGVYLLRARVGADGSLMKVNRDEFAQIDGSLHALESNTGLGIHVMSVWMNDPAKSAVIGIVATDQAPPAERWLQLPGESSAIATLITHNDTAYLFVASIRTRTVTVYPANDLIP